MEGVYNNAAAPAVREAHSVNWFEWVPTAGIALPGVYSGTDFNNRGDTRAPTDDFLYLQGGAWAQFGSLGLTATADLLRYDVSSGAPNTPSIGLSLTRFHVVAAYSFLNNQLCVGAGVRAVYVNINERDGPNGAVIEMLGAAPQVGVIVKPNDVPWRVGATARAAVEAGLFDVDGAIDEPTPGGGTARRAGSFFLPDRIRQPWELEAGVAYQLGPRPLNPAWIDPREHEDQLERKIEQARAARRNLQEGEIAALPVRTPEDRIARELRISRIRAEEEEAREAEDAALRDQRLRLKEERKARYSNWPREHVLLLASLLLTGPSVGSTVALEGFIDQRRDFVGKRVAFAPRFAVESEAVPNLLKFRAGVYLEPSRFSTGRSRQHLTFGADVRLFAWNVFGLLSDHVWRLSTFVDIAPRYQNFGFAIGAWH